VWHELTDFTPQAAVLVIASTLYDEAEYLRDYGSSSAKRRRGRMIPFLDMKAVYAELKPELDAAYARVMESGWFVLGRRSRPSRPNTPPSAAPITASAWPTG
jgi:hypothetical protein